MNQVQSQEQGVRIAGVGSAVPDGVLTNAELEKIMDTSDEWIVQRTGIHERRKLDPRQESCFTLARDSLIRALDNAGLQGSDLDLIILGTVTAEMTCPSNACRIAAEIGAQPAAAFDLVAACSGYVYSLNVAETMVRSGRYNKVGVIGCDAMTTIVDYDDRSVSILFGDAAGAAILVADDDKKLGCRYQLMQSDGRSWESLYIPRREVDVPESDSDNPIKLGCLRMAGREVYKFAVTKFREVIEDALDKTGLQVDDVASSSATNPMFASLNLQWRSLDCHQKRFTSILTSSATAPLVRLDYASINFGRRARSSQATSPFSSRLAEA